MWIMSQHGRGFKGQKEINFSELEPGEFPKVLGRLVWHVGFLVFTHCMNLKRLSPCQRFGLLGLNSFLPTYRQGWYHRRNLSYCCSAMFNKNIYSAKQAFMDVFQQLIRTCCCQTKMFANEQQENSQVIQTDWLFIWSAKNPIPRLSYENMLLLILDLSKASMEQHIRVRLFCLLLSLRDHLAHDGFGIAWQLLIIPQNKIEGWRIFGFILSIFR